MATVDRDEELAAAVAGREHWRLVDHSALYAPPGATAAVRVQPLMQPTRRARYLAVIVRGDTVERSLPCPTASSAITWAERIRLD